MRTFVGSLAGSVLLLLGLGVVGSIPAAAGPGYTGSNSPSYSDDGVGRREQRTRLARATYNDASDEENAAPRRHYRSYDADDTDRRPRYSQPRQKRSAKHQKRRQTIAGRNKGQRVAHNRTTPPTAAPSWSKRSLSTDGPRGSGQLGVASFYWQPQRLAAGGWFNPNAMTAAHKTLPFGTRVRVTHQGNGRSVEVVINDRGPYIAGRIIDLSKAAASVIGMTGQGIARVAVEVLGR
jgi:rare lipoprotein A